MNSEQMNGHDESRNNTVNDAVTDDVTAAINYIYADIQATANAVPANPQYGGTDATALQLDGPGAAPPRNIEVDPWQNQTLPQGTFENATVSPEAAWSRFRPGEALAPPPAQARTMQQQPQYYGQQPYYNNQGGHFGQQAYDANWNYVAPQGSPVPMQPPQ